MSDTTYVDFVAPAVNAEWLNEINDHVWHDTPVSGLTVHNANVIGFTPSMDLSSTNVQDVINELNSKIEPDTIITSINSLRLIDKTEVQYVEVVGYYTAGDGGGGFYWYDSTDTISADNGGTIIVATDGGRWKLINTGVVSVKQFGAKSDGITNSRLEIKAALNALDSAGGGTITFPEGDYLISGDDGLFNLKELDNNLQYVDTPNRVQMYFSDLNNLRLVFNGGRLVSDATTGGFTLVFDGCNNISIETIRMRGATVMSGDTATVTGTLGLGLWSRTANSDSIKITSPQIDKHYGSIDIAGDPASSFIVSNVVIDGSPRITNGYYGLSCRGNGRNVRLRNGYSYRQNRPFFIYDTRDVSVQMVGDDMNGGYQALVKAYTINVFNIDIDFFVENRSNTQSCLGFQSQHNPGIQVTPASIANVNVFYRDFNCPIGGSSIRFDYYQNNTLTATTGARIFNEFDIKGSASGTLTSAVTITTHANSCALRLEDFLCNNGKAIYTNASGFVPARNFTWTPTDNSGAGLALTVLNARYTVGNTVEGSFHITFPVTANGAGVNIAGLPIRTAALGTDHQAVVFSYTDVGFPIYGLISDGAYNFRLYKNTGSAVTNAEMSGKSLRGSFNYIV